jgi:hypothetical protein
VEEVDEVDVKGFGSEMGLDEMIYCGFEHESIVNGYHPDRWLKIPTRLATTGDRSVHDVVRNEEKCLKLKLILSTEVLF